MYVVIFIIVADRRVGRKQLLPNPPTTDPEIRLSPITSGRIVEGRDADWGSQTTGVVSSFYSDGHRLLQTTF